MSDVLKIVCCCVVAPIAGLAALGVLVGRAFGPGPVPSVLLLAAFFYGWMLFAFLHYRQVRQAEFLYLLTTAAESGAPLAPALRAYLGDRPGGAAREVWVGGLLF